MTDGHPNPPADWYPDPSDAPGTLRYWDGIRWTDHFAEPILASAPPASLPWYARGWRWALLAWSLLLAFAAIAGNVTDYTDATGNFYGLDSDYDVTAFLVDLGVRFAFTWGLFGGWLPIRAWRKRREVGLTWAGQGSGALTH